MDSHCGEGTTSKITLPVACQPSPGRQEISPSAAAEEHRDATHRGQTVLVVDDEEDILKLTETMLSRQGHTVLSTQSGRAALDLLKEDRPDLILSDWRMPGLDGVEFSTCVREMYPELAKRFIFFTGDVLNEDLQALIDECGAAFLAKPFSLEEFRAVVEVTAHA